ncbi:MAG: hypothetical protein EA376_13320 [Phycisphaeraceae bacterium]|nr:MAG: hypothetical protein EA376_13320 [Phycisphaeraceae bacterium]
MLVDRWIAMTPRGRVFEVLMTIVAIVVVFVVVMVLLLHSPSLQSNLVASAAGAACVFLVFEGRSWLAGRLVRRRLRLLLLAEGLPICPMCGRELPVNSIEKCPECGASPAMEL